MDGQQSFRKPNYQSFVTNHEHVKPYLHKMYFGEYTYSSLFEQRTSLVIYHFYICFQFEHKLVLVMERPVSSMDLFKYLEDHKRSLEEHEAKLVGAAIDMHSKGVFHQDIKLKNVLVTLKQAEPEFLSSTWAVASSQSHGNREYFPPKFFEIRYYWACSTTVWQLCVLFYSLLGGHDQITTKGFINGQVQINSVRSPAYTCALVQGWATAWDPHPALHPNGDKA
ncbi:hypothetical protein Q5P01_021966 [Channa striata]|uniref:Serine/threonine-protein kinase 1 n=1 Tax=Channa striata TaxID=64152 RepID=A0AA88IYS8_CHASR|nr:hypothetical protein Q5P01_021966 [Channa striata]